MSGITQSSRSAIPRAGMVDAGLSALRAAAGWPGRVYRARQMLHTLGQLDEHELRDIGLSRLDLGAASALPLDADPSLVLRTRADERRRRS